MVVLRAVRRVNQLEIGRSNERATGSVTIARTLWAAPTFLWGGFPPRRQLSIAKPLDPYGGDRHDAVVATIEETGPTGTTVLVWNR